MIIYKDIVTGKEVLTDSYKIVEVEGTEGALLEVTGKHTMESTDISDSLIGGNASAEGEDADAGAEASSKSGIDVVLANRLVEISMTKAEYKLYLKTYAKSIVNRLKKSNPEREAVFMKGAKVLSQKLLGIFSDAQLFVGEDPQGEAFDDKAPCMVILAVYEGDKVLLYYWKDGLDEEKA